MYTSRSLKSRIVRWNGNKMELTRNVHFGQEAFGKAAILKVKLKWFCGNYLRVAGFTCLGTVALLTAELKQENDSES